MKVAEAASDAFGQLQQAFDGFHDAVGQAGFHVRQDAVEVTFDGASQFATTVIKKPRDVSEAGNYSGESTRRRGRWRRR